MKRSLASLAAVMFAWQAGTAAEIKIGVVAELTGDIFVLLLVFLVHKGETKGLDVLCIHFGDNLYELDRIGYVRVLHDVLPDL